MYGITGPRGHMGTVLTAWAKAQLGEDVVPIHADITSVEELRTELQLSGVTTLIHTAAIVGTVACEDAGPGAIATNVTGTYNVAQACRDLGIRLVYLSSSAVYDPAGSEDMAHTISEVDPIKPHSIYPTTKYAGELVCHNYLSPNKLMILRPGPIYGGGSDVSMISHAMRQRLRDGVVTFHLDPTKLKDYMWNEDFAHLAWGLILNDQTWSQTFNVSRGRPQLFQLILSILRRNDLMPRFSYCRPDKDALMHHVPLNTKARMYVTSYDPDKTVDIEEGIMRTWQKLTAS